MLRINLDDCPHGPLVELTVGVSNARAAELRSQGHPIPAPVRLRGLLDTGASHTCIDIDVVRMLALTPTGKALLATPAGGSKRRRSQTTNEYDVTLTLWGDRACQKELHTDVMPVCECVLPDHSLPQKPFLALIGRDLLDQLVFKYDGVRRAFSLKK